ncbi:MAG: FAD-dependent oxidoreductase [Chloroflexota bacterium]|nr:MAG: FAD-dependent oxidoreductase [Chloroflexota bacterium]
MNQVGTEAQPLRVAVIGAGPAGFYTAERLFKQKDLVVEVDMFDRLPTPYGLVRAGVAPDHQKIKSVTKVFDRVAGNIGFRFFGYVEIGRDIDLADLEKHYHQIVYATGAQTDRRLNIPGIDLAGSHAATSFVAWYNGHPDYRDLEFDLSVESAAVIGIGNVAVDVARILCRTPDELEETDIADHALEALRASRVKDVYMLGRRGPAQGKFTSPELKELGEMSDADLIILPEEAQLDELSEQSLATADRGTLRQVEIINDFAGRPASTRSRRLHLRFLVSPTELCDDGDGRVSTMRIVRNELYATSAGTLRSRATDNHESIDVGLVFRAVGYRGVPIPGVPFYDDWGVILNVNGRVVETDTQRPRIGHYTAGWIKRGPSGVIGTNKPDAAETVEQMLSDLSESRLLKPPSPTAEAAGKLIKDRQPEFFSFDDWRRLDQLEIERGQMIGRPRVKFTRIADMLAAKQS